MHSLTINLHHHIGKGGDISSTRGSHHSALSMVPASGDRSFAGILNEKKESAAMSFSHSDPHSALPTPPESGHLRNKSSSLDGFRKDVPEPGDPPSIPSSEQDPSEESTSDATALERIDAPPSSVSALTQSAATASSNQASPESRATDAAGKGWGVMARGLGITPGSPEFHALKGRNGIGNATGLGGITAIQDGTHGSADTPVKQISAATTISATSDRASKPFLAASLMTHTSETTEEPAPESLMAGRMSSRSGLHHREGTLVPPEDPSAEGPSARHGTQGERPVSDRITANLPRGQNEASPEGMVSRVLPSDVFRREELATLPFKETPAASNRPAHHSATGKIDQGVGTAIPESGEPKAISPANANAVKEVPATALSTDGDENQASGPTRIINVTGRDTWPLRAEWISAIHAPEAETPLSGALPAHRTQAIIEQIMDARQGMQGDFGRIRILLTPPNLGTVDLQILMRRDRVEVIMMADNAGVQQALLSRTEDIRAALQRQDIKIETFEVLLQDRSADQRQAGSGAMFDHQQEREDKQFFMDSDPLLRAAVAISPGNDLKPDGGQVSIFV